jgi:hypothetical protein
MFYVFADKNFKDHSDFCEITDYLKDIRDVEREMPNADWEMAVVYEPKLVIKKKISI